MMGYRIPLEVTLTCPDLHAQNEHQGVETLILMMEYLIPQGVTLIDLFRNLKVAGEIRMMVFHILQGVTLISLKNL